MVLLRPSKKPSWIRNSVSYKVGFNPTSLSMLEAFSQPHAGLPQVLTLQGRGGVYPERWQIIFSTLGISLWSEAKEEIWHIQGILS